MKRRLLVALAAVLAAVAAAAVPVATASRAHVPHNLKRGVGSSWYMWFNPQALTRVGATWAYDWSTQLPKAVPGIEWVPMVWGSRSVTPGALRSLRADARSHRARYLLAFNEPDLRSQANMTPAQAAALWPSLEKTGLKLGAPAPAIWFGKWLAQFMALARSRHLRVDFINLHFYQDFTVPNAVGLLRNHLLAAWKLYHRPIWVTEIGTADIRAFGERIHHKPTQALALRYMRQALAMLDSLPFVQRYAWFTDRCWHEKGCELSSLFSDGRAHVTALGRLYATAP
jgi:Glycosyl hydrolase catalytic core